MHTIRSEESPQAPPADPVTSALRIVGLDRETPPTPEQWSMFLDTLDNGDDRRFENLFSMSPVPTLEQDYSLLVEWMGQLRRTGVTSIREYLCDDLELIRDAASMIVNVAVNPAAVEVIGLARDESVGPMRREIVNEEAVEAWIEQLELVWDGKSFGVTTFKAARTSGEQFDARRTLAIPDGRFGPDYSRAVMTIEDITEHRKEERRMQEAMEARTRFLASVSHEIRTPLTGILGFSEVLTDSPELLTKADAAEIIHSIFDQARDLSNIVDDLLVAAQTELGSIAMVDEPVDVQAEITRVLESGGSFTHLVRRESATRAPIARGDAGRFRQIIRNLLTNAERYGGDDVLIGVETNGDSIFIEVSDNGTGVPDAMAEQIFEPYRRAHDHATTPDSVGIGLAICRQFAELMSGSLAYRYEDGRARFLLTLPAH